jgi:FlaA1/EpsC-like NDP-sugar epimerase
MGMTKRAAEMYVHALGAERDADLFVVRFGNVLGSSGSVVPIFRDQIRNGGPVTVTDPKMTRYVMSIPEAVQLVLQASAGGKAGEILVLDMGDPMPIVELARELIGLAGLREPEDIRIEYTGARPGEKLEETLVSSEETLHEGPHPKVRSARGPLPGLAELEERLLALAEAAEAGEENTVRELLSRMTATRQADGLAVPSGAGTGESHPSTTPSQ